MLDFKNLDFSNICENWFLNFNDFLKDDKFNYIKNAEVEIFELEQK